MLQRQIDVVVAVHQTPTHVIVHLERQGHVTASDGASLQRDSHLATRLFLQQLPQELDGLLRHNRGQHAVLGGVAVEDVGEARRDDHAETVIVQRPHGVLAGGADAEFGAGDQNLALTGVFRLVEHEVRVSAPCVEQGVIEAGLGHALQEHSGNDLVGIDVGAAQRHAHAGQCGEFFHNNFPFGDLSPSQSSTDSPSSEGAHVY